MHVHKIVIFIFIEKELTSQFRKLAKKWHPDRATNQEQDEEFTETFKQIQISKDWMLSFGNDEEKWQYEVGGMQNCPYHEFDEERMDDIFGIFMEDLFFEHLFGRGRGHPFFHGHRFTRRERRRSSSSGDEFFHEFRKRARRRTRPSTEEFEIREENKRKQRESEIENLRRKNDRFDRLFLEIEELKNKKEKLNGPKMKKKRKNLNKTIRELEKKFEKMLSKP
jgi:hypothetical protein